MGALSRSGWTATSSDDLGTGFTPDLSIDANVSTYWHSGTNTTPHTLHFDLGSAQTFDGLQFIPRQPAGIIRVPLTWQIDVSADDSTWTTVATGSWTDDRNTKFVTFAPQTKRYVRLIALTTSDGYAACSEFYLWFHADFAPHDLTTFSSGTDPRRVLASSFFSTLPPWKAFDGNTSTYWAGSNSGVDWLQLDAAAYGYLLNDYSIQVNVVPEPNRAPKNWTMKGSDDGSSWTVVDTQTNQIAWSSGETRNFTCATRTTAYRYFRLDVTTNNGDTFTQCAELYMYGTFTETFGACVVPYTMGNNTTPSPFVISASSVFSAGAEHYAFSLSSGPWIGTGGGVDWLKVDLGSGVARKIYSYDLLAAATANRAPKNWTFEGSNDNSTWTTLDTRTNETSWGSGERRSYVCSSYSGAYRYLRINITANNGDATYTEIDQMYVFGITGTPIVGGTVQPIMQVIM